MLATQLRFLDGVQLLLANGAQVDKANDRGETPLIRAVQLHDLAMVRFLIANGANPDKADTLAGMSALDYAKRDTRSTAILSALNAAKASKSAASEVERSEERRVGKECVRTCRSRWSPDNKKK